MLPLGISLGPFNLLLSLGSFLLFALASVPSSRAPFLFLFGLILAGFALFIKLLLDCLLSVFLRPSLLLLLLMLAVLSCVQKLILRLLERVLFRLLLLLLPRRSQRGFGHFRLWYNVEVTRVSAVLKMLTKSCPSSLLLHFKLVLRESPCLEILVSFLGEH